MTLSNTLANCILIRGLHTIGKRKVWGGLELCVNSAGQDVTACKVLLLQETWNVCKFQTNFIVCHMMALRVENSFESNCTYELVQ